MVLFTINMYLYLFKGNTQKSIQRSLIINWQFIMKLPDIQLDKVTGKKNNTAAIHRRHLTMAFKRHPGRDLFDAPF